eukprot:8714495-Heterocapsa_arctica.AAC.1
MPPMGGGGSLVIRLRRLVILWAAACLRLRRLVIRLRRLVIHLRRLAHNCVENDQRFVRKSMAKVRM